MTPKQRVERYPNLQEGIDLETLLAIELLAKKDGRDVLRPRGLWCRCRKRAIRPLRKETLGL